MIRWIKVEHLGPRRLYRLTIGSEDERVVVITFNEMEFEKLDFVIKDVEKSKDSNEITKSEWSPITNDN